MSDAQPRLRIPLIRLALFLILIGLAVLTVRQFYGGQARYQVQVFQTPTGWGYQILNNKKLLIYQPTIPGQSGTVGFTSPEQARRVGERMAGKLQETMSLPSLTNDEMRQLGVKIP